VDQMHYGSSKSPLRSPPLLMSRYQGSSVGLRVGWWDFRVEESDSSSDFVGFASGPRSKPMHCPSRPTLSTPDGSYAWIWMDHILNRLSSRTRGRSFSTRPQSPVCESQGSALRSSDRDTNLRPLRGGLFPAR